MMTNSVTIPEKIELLTKAEIAITQAIGFMRRAYPTRDPVCLEELYCCQEQTREQLRFLEDMANATS